MNAIAAVGIVMIGITAGCLGWIVRQRIRLKWSRPGALFPIVGIWWTLVNLVSLVGFLTDAYVSYPDPASAVPEAWLAIALVAIFTSICAAVVATLAAAIFGIQQIIVHRRYN